MSNPYDSFVLVGRFQTLTAGHCSLIDMGMSLCDRGIVFVGSSQESGTERNPFDVGTRIKMLEAVYGDSIEICPLPDMTHENDITAEWGRYVIQKTKERFLKMPEMMIYGNDESRSRWFAPEDITWTEVVVARSRIPISGTQMRQFMVEDRHEDWFLWTHPRLHKLYPQLRAQLMAVPYYQELARNR